MLRSRPWYLYGCIENVHNEADEVMPQVRSRTLAIEKWRCSAFLHNRCVFFFRVASLIVPKRGEQTATTTLDNDRRDDDMHCCHVCVSNVFPLRQKGGGACRVDGRDEKAEGQTSAGARGVFSNVRVAFLCSWRPLAEPQHQANSR